MIDISQYLNPDTIVTNLNASNKEGVIELLIDKLYEDPTMPHLPIDKKVAYDAVAKRESLQSTGIGNELAFPHARIEGWGNFRMALGILKDGVDFNALDGKPVKYVFLMLSSTDQPYMVLQAMSAIIRFIENMNSEEDKALDSPIGIESMLDIIQKKELTATDQILACDIARPAKNCVTLNTSLEEVTQKMHVDRLSILPVIGKDNKFYGEISCYDIFTFGMPDFFRQLQTISFVKHIDPFEKYFSIKKGLKIKDLKLKKEEGIKKDSTLLEIVFEMSVKKKSKLFMVEENGTLAGVIDRFCIIDKILFF